MWVDFAPSNIALIKYMGKTEGNIPCNVSLSYTLDKFVTRVVLELCSNNDCFVNEIGLSDKSVDRFLNHLKNIKRRYDYDGFFRVRSSNNFPHSAGIASSSSSFAALTKCALKAVCEIKGRELPSPEEMSAISREASGASCRSFFAPWSVWNREGGRKIDIAIDRLEHDLILINATPKKVSSSEAHQLVRSSPLFVGRAQRAEKRFVQVIDSLNSGDWSNSYQICWEEFQDMHSLFETSSPSFSYMESKTISALEIIKEFWKSHNDGPVVTMDAGPNVHLLWRKDQTELRSQLVKEFNKRNFIS